MILLPPEGQESVTTAAVQGASGICPAIGNGIAWEGSNPGKRTLDMSIPALLKSDSLWHHLLWIVLTPFPYPVFWLLVTLGTAATLVAAWATWTLDWYRAHLFPSSPETP